MENNSEEHTTEIPKHIENESIPKNPSSTPETLIEADEDRLKDSAFNKSRMNENDIKTGTIMDISTEKTGHTQNDLNTTTPTEAKKNKEETQGQDKNREGIDLCDIGSAIRDGTLTASDYLAIQEELEKEAAQVLPGKFDQCTWSKGYIRQNVYTCLTCSRLDGNVYIENIGTTTSIGAFENVDVGDDFISSILDEALAKTRNTVSSQAVQQSEPNPSAEITGKHPTNRSSITWDHRVSNNALKDNDPTVPPPRFQFSGICYGCSISCHSNHDVIELFAKRDFRCDCGTAKMQKEDKVLCSLKKDAPKLTQTLNFKNNYNHNFWGYYCRCDTFYDPNNEAREMIQCFACNDWFHDECIGKIPDENAYESYICRVCVGKCPVIAGTKSRHVMKGLVDPESQKVSAIIISNTYAPNDDKPAENLVEQVDFNHQRNAQQLCRTDFIDVGQESGKQYDLFVTDDWAKDICKCTKCKRIVEECKMSFIYEDTNIYEPEIDEAKDESLYEAGIKELEKMDRVKAIEGSAAFQNLYQDIKQFLEPFACTKRIVESKDIKEFFDQIKTKKSKTG